MSALTRASFGVAATAACLAMAACGSGGGSASEGGEPTNTEVVTHNEAGGGSDVFTRQVIKILADNDIIDSQWPVKNIPAGDSIGAMSYMIERDADPNVIAQMTPTWIATPMTVEDAGVSVDQLTPLAMLAEEPQVVAARADFTLRVTCRLHRGGRGLTWHPRPVRWIQHCQRRAHQVGA